MKVLIVEDDVNLAKALGYILMENKYEVDLVHNGEDGLNYGKSDDYDIIILDVMIPKMDGNEVCKQLRRSKINTPIIMLTAKDSIKSKIEGLDSGADDYMTKPFAPAELLAHLRALTRRKGEVIFEELEHLDLKLNLSSHDLSCKAKTVNLSYKEFCIMEILMQNTSSVVSKQNLIDKVWGTNSTAEDNNVEAYISFLRRKLEFLKSKAKIETLRKAGYRLVAADDK